MTATNYPNLKIPLPFGSGIFNLLFTIRYAHASRQPCADVVRLSCYTRKPVSQLISQPILTHQKASFLFLQKFANFLFYLIFLKPRNGNLLTVDQV